MGLIKDSHWPPLLYFNCASCCEQADYQLLWKVLHIFNRKTSTFVYLCVMGCNRLNILQFPSFIFLSSFWLCKPVVLVNVWLSLSLCFFLVYWRSTTFFSSTQWSKVRSSVYCSFVLFFSFFCYCFYWVWVRQWCIQPYQHPTWSSV